MTGDSGQRATSVFSFFRNVNENIVCNDMQIEKIIQIDKHLLLRFFFLFLTQKSPHFANRINILVLRM